ncbi:MAG: histidine--tRNA ligase [Cyclobacteriaceae bacterium]
MVSFGHLRMDKPTLPKGTRDFGPAVMAKRQFILSQVRSVFEKYGFQPLETPAMENLSTLTGKYGDEGDQLLFRILDSGDFVGEDGIEFLKDTMVNSPDIDWDNVHLNTFREMVSGKGLRYDLTVPFSRYVVMNRHEVTFPFRRYQIQPVWRADRPQKGRYREFYQCDADVVGTDSLIPEAEIILMIKEVFGKLGIADYTIKINHRGVLTGIAELVKAKGKEGALFVAIDKLDKIGEGAVREELANKGFDQSGIDTLFNLLKTEGSNSEKLTKLSEQFIGNAHGEKGVADLRETFQLLGDAGGNQDHLEFDISLARGLSYYTGAIFEVKVNNVSIGSVSGGGRYDNLTGVFGMPGVSGVGISFGVDRLYDVMEELNLFPADTLVSTQVLIAHLDSNCKRYGLTVLQQLRNHEISSEIYPDDAKVKKQFDFANKKFIPFVIVIGTDEMTSGKLTFKDMKTGTQSSLRIEEIVHQLTSS